jgi:hypothetical protein
VALTREASSRSGDVTRGICRPRIHNNISSGLRDLGFKALQQSTDMLLLIETPNTHRDVIYAGLSSSDILAYPSKENARVFSRVKVAENSVGEPLVGWIFLP